MIFFTTIFCIAVTFSAVSAANLGNETVGASCTVTSYNDVESAVSSCTTLIIQGITVPAGKTLSLALKAGSKLTFEGTIKFEYVQWAGPLIMVSGSGVTVTGASGSVLDGQGKLYWEHDRSITKPKFIRIQTTDNSKFENINLLNCPTNCVSIGSHSTTLSGWNIDCSAGDSSTATGHNTDGFDISSSTNIVIENSVVKNQDDCVAINYASNITVKGLTCSGGHGLSLSVGMSKTDPSTNVVSNVLFSDCTVTKSANGIHVKTHKDGTTGYIKDVTYENIKLSSIVNYGISIQEDYGPSGGGDGTPVGNVPITNLKMINVKGTMSGGSKSMPVYILCGTGGCSDWTWSEVSITGGKKSSSCNFKPSGFSC